MLSVVRQAYVEGVSTRGVDDLVRSLGCEGISKSQVARICTELDGVVASFLRGLRGGSARGALRPWGGEPYEEPGWRTVTPYADHHVAWQYALYSVLKSALG